MAEVFWTLPPVSRTITAAAVAVSALGYSGIIDLEKYLWYTPYVFTLKILPPQVWRLVSAFLVTGPRIGIIMDPYFLYMYGSGLETESSRFPQPGDFFVYTVFVGALIVALAGCVLNAYSFLTPLSLAFAHTYAQDNPNRKVSFFIITFDAKYLPWAMLLMTFVMEGPTRTMQQGCGLLAAHCYDFLTRIWPAFGGGKNYIVTPQIVKAWFGANAGTEQRRSYGTARQGRPQEEPADARSTGRSTGFGGQGFGPGRRLGE
ncbi:Der1-like family-domain-containing protein [Dendryphion nanum]|uniref:Derlin n=1 Tax=Dendryphion nanum TaxID=256645 RepID=A0A9P9IKP2_9PLEO|nr:Der1-like family-domain-containing protein [Dendryphion nanum]